MPPWLLPVFVLLGLALIPLAFFVAMALLALALGSLVLRALLPSQPSPVKNGNVFSRESRSSFSDQPVLDVDYEIKDEHEKDKRE